MTTLKRTQKRKIEIQREKIRGISSEDMSSENINKHRHRAKTLNDIKDWCFGRASQLSLAGQHQAAQALTNEHMEALEVIRPEKMLWLKH